MMRARIWMALVCVLGGCAPDAGVGTAALSGPDDCRLEDSCEGYGPSTPLERPWVTPRLDDVPKFDGEFVPVETLEAYRDDTAGWQRGAAGYAARNGAVFGLATFAPGREPDQHGVVMLWSTAIASREEPSVELFPTEGNDVPGLLRMAQTYAHARGYAAALPAFERVDSGEGMVERMLVLSNAAVEVHYVDLLALGVRDVSDVPSVFAGANRYALEQGFAGGIPTFDTLSDGDRTAIGVIVVLFEHGYPLELPGPEITPRCSGSPFCPLETTCGGLGQACCQSFCEAGVQCTFHGLESSRNCLLPPPLTAVFCGNGRCEAGEPCSCPDDCGNSCTICLPSRLAAYCVTCPGELPRTTFFTDCDDPHVDGCTVRRGICR